MSYNILTDSGLTNTIPGVETIYETKVATSYVSYSGSLPMTLCSVPVGSYITNITITTVTGFVGGYGSEAYEAIAGNMSWGPQLMSNCINSGPKLIHGKYISKMGYISDTPMDISFKLFYSLYEGSNSFSMVTVVSGYHTASPQLQWFDCCYKIPTIYGSDQWSAGVETSSTNGLALLNPRTGSDAFMHAPGLADGDYDLLEGWSYYGSRSWSLGVRYAAAFRIGTVITQDAYVSDFMPIGITSIDLDTYAASSGVVLYRDSITAADTQGYMKIDVTYRAAYIKTEPIPSYNKLELSDDQLRGLITEGSSITVTSGSYVGLRAQFGMDMVCSSAKIFCDYIASGAVKVLYKEFLENQFVYDGVYNYNTDYATPYMTSNLDPEPYACSGTTTWDPVWYAAYKAFNQTADDSLDCWMSVTGAPGYPPQSLMFYFPYPKIINRFALQARNNATLRNFPKTVYFQGNVIDSPSLTDDTHWETIYYKTGLTDPGAAGWSTFCDFINPKGYHYYRLKVTESNGTYVAIANVKLVEANRPQSVPVYTWTEVDMVWAGDGYVYNFSTPIGLEEVQFAVSTLSGAVTVRGANLTVPTDFVSLSGVVASGIYVDNYAVTNRTFDPFIFRIQNLMPGNAQPYTLFKYTGVFDIDRNIFISPDYTQAYDKDAATWYGLDHGYTVPEIDDFESGTFINTKMLGREVVLEDTKATGQWRSPVIDTENKSVAAYIYALGDVDVYVRASETPPSLVNFMIITTDPTHRWLMYDHKRVYIDSYGSVIGSSVCDTPENGSKLWRVAGFDWAGVDLMYYGAINPHGTAALLVPGYTDCGDTTPEQEFTEPNYWYNLGLCSMDDASQWGVGTSVSGLPYGPNTSVIFTKVFPVKESDGFFCFTVSYDSTTLYSTLYMSFQQSDYTMAAYPMFKIEGEISPLSKMDVAYDDANSSWWVYLAGSLYKIDAGSINNVRTFASQGLRDESGEQVPDTMKGYIWKIPVDREWRGMAAIPSQDYSYFWVFTETAIYLYEERYQSGEPELVERVAITTGVQVESGFTDFLRGSCDSYGNIWALDTGQDRIIRVNMQKALAGDPRAVDYENQVAGVVGLWAHPTDGTCFLLQSDEPEHPYQDVIRMVHAGQRWGSQGKYVCSVPGFYSKPYTGGVFFTGNSFSGRIRPHESDPMWGNNNLEINGSLNTSTDYATPIMASNTTTSLGLQSYTISATTQDITAWQSFDRVNRWRADTYSRSAIMVQFPEAVLINKYAFYFTHNYTADWPPQWEIQVPRDGYETSALVSNDEHWTTLDSRSDSCPGLQTWTPYYSFINPKPSILYRIRLAPSPTGYASVGNIKLIKAQESSAWMKYEPGRLLPRGRYKQIRVDLSRQPEAASPRLQRVRLPQPVPLDPLSYKQETGIALKSTLNKARVSGDWDTKLLVWWYNEEM
jgi:hypothetical protein